MIGSAIANDHAVIYRSTLQFQLFWPATYRADGCEMSFKDILVVPQVYQMLQELGGFYAGQLKAIEKYLKPKTGDRVIDIGCGPGYLARECRMASTT